MAVFQNGRSQNGRSSQLPFPIVALPKMAIQKKVFSHIGRFPKLVTIPKMAVNKNCCKYHFGQNIWKFTLIFAKHDDNIGTTPITIRKDTLGLYRSKVHF